MSIASVSSALVTKVKGVSGVSQSAVFDFDNPSFSAYPWVCVTLKEWTHKWLTNVQNEIHYVFTIRVYQEIAKTNEGPQQSESNLRDLMDALVSAFNSDNKLANSDVYTKPISGRSGWVDVKRYFEIDVEAVDVITSVG